MRRTEDGNLVITFEERMQMRGWSKVIFREEKKDETEGQEVLSDCRETGEIV